MVTLAWILLAIGATASFIGFIILVVAAFRISAGWGLAVLFLSGFVIPLIVFLVKYWEDARTGFLISLGGWIVGGIGSFVLIGAMATTAMAELDTFEFQEPVGRPRFDSVESENPSEDLSLPTPGRPSTAEVPTLLPSLAEALDEGDEVTEPEEEAAADAESTSASELATATTVVPFEELDQHLGKLIEIRLQDGSHMRVFLDAVTADGIQVTQRVGGGTVSYSIKREMVVEINVW